MSNKETDGDRHVERGLHTTDLEKFGTYKSQTTQTDSASKRVMLNAERHDTIEITGGGMGAVDAFPKLFTVVRRTEPYFGPQLLLDRKDTEEPENWMLTCPGPDTDLLLWTSVTDDDGFRRTWAKFAEVTAEIADVYQYDICESCEEPIKTLEHERMAAFGICPGDSNE